MDQAEEWITPTEAARRVVSLGYAHSMTRQRIYQLAANDPDWPAPRDQWRQLGAYRLLPWHLVQPYFKARGPQRSGRKGWATPSEPPPDPFPNRPKRHY